MHERNLYRTPPNFASLAKKYSFFAQFLTLDVKGTARINFKDEEALRALTKVLLLNDFGLDIEIPPGVLIPTVPLRLNYMLWIEDLLGLSKCGGQGGGGSGGGNEVRGLDIGTGATAIYALLGAKKNKWKMTGTEVDQNHILTARRNVSKNGLEDYITIVLGNSESILTPTLTSSSCPAGYFDFTMCNPPFFGSDEETDSSSKGRHSGITGEDPSSGEVPPKRQPPSAAKTGKGSELVAEGGEVEFIRKMIKESLRFPQKVKIYTTMVGIKRHLKPLLYDLKSHGIVNYTTTEFVQGKTMRWGLAWSLFQGVTLFPPHPDLVGVFPNFSTLLNFESLLTSYLSELKLHTMRWLPFAPSNNVLEPQDDDQDSPPPPPCLEVIATSNTWSHQRRKRRQMERGEDQESGSPPKKRPNDNKMDNATSIDLNDTPVLIHLLMDFIRDNEDAKIVLRYRGGSLGKEGMNQILLYLKNRYTKDAADPNSSVFQIMHS